MKTVLERNEVTTIKERSSFIGIIVHLNDAKDAKRILDNVKKEYPKAKHYCYAYIVDEFAKSSDDGEPSGTAGRPLLELLKKKGMNEVMAIVVRYFGGIKLGASRLLSTYVEAMNVAIEGADIYEIECRYVYQVNLSYREFEILKRIAINEGFTLDNVRFEDKIKVDVFSKTDDVTSLINNFPNADIEVFGTRKVYVRD